MYCEISIKDLKQKIEKYNDDDILVADTRSNDLSVKLVKIKDGVPDFDNTEILYKSKINYEYLK